MISENQKISQRQFGRMVVMDWLAKAALLLPGFAENESGRSFILSLIAGVSLAVAYAWVVGWTARHMEQGMYAYTAERLGGGCAKVLMLFYFCYALMNSVLLVRLFGVVAQVFVLPEMSQSVLMAAVVLGGVYIISGGLEVRARVSEVLFSALLYPLLFLLVCAAFSTESGYLGTGRAEFSMQTAKHGLQTFIAFGGTGIFLFLAPSLNKRENTGRTLVRAAIVTGVSVLALCLASIGSFGESGMRALPWPAITLMSSAVIPGSFFQRWDVVFTGLMLATLFPAVGAGMYYLKFLSEGLLGKGKNRGGGRNIRIGFLVYLFALWCGTYDTAFRVFTVVNGYVCVPILVIFTLTLAIVECAGRRRG